MKAFHRSGPAHADFFDYDVLPTITTKSVEFVNENAKTDKPFFLYVPLNSPHTPISPSKSFQGKSGLGKYADFVMETDWSIGQIVDAVEKNGIQKDTLIMVTADNGCSPAAASRAGRNTLNLTFNEGNMSVAEAGKHYACGIYRGHKADIYEGGHRVPFIARWDGKIRAGSECNAPVCHVDLFSTCAELAGDGTDDSAAVDSISFLPHLLGRADAKVRDSVVHHSIQGRFAIRSGKWKLAFCSGSGGWSAPRPPKDQTVRQLSEQQRAKLAQFQLFNLETDPSEQKNVAREHPEIVERLTSTIRKHIDDGRTTPGPIQQNDGKTPLYPDWVRQAREHKSFGTAQ